MERVSPILGTPVNYSPAISELPAGGRERLRLQFDPHSFSIIDQTGARATAIAAGSVLPTVLLNRVDYAQGLISFAAGQALEGGQPLTAGSHVIAQIKLRTDTSTPGGTIAFLNSAPSPTTVTTAALAEDILHRADGATIVVRTGLQIRGQVRLNRGIAEADVRVRPVRVRVFLDDGRAGAARTLVAAQDVTTDAAGNFTVILPQLSRTTSYLVNAKSPHGISREQPWSAAVASTPLDFGPQPVGDTDGNDVVDIRDFVTLVYTFASTSDLRADFNEDGVISVLDYSLPDFPDTLEVRLAFL